MNRSGSVSAVLFVGAALLTIGAATTPGAQRGQAVQIVSGAGKCLDVHEPDQYNNGGRVQVWTCNGRKQQDWFVERGALRSSVGKCLDVSAPDQRGARVQIWDCNGAPQQRWSFDRNDNKIRIGDKCLDVHAADQRKDGATVQVWDCLPAAEQQTWFVRGR
jgi:Ricin-type beta-trefoil lectin domain